MFIISSVILSFVILTTAQLPIHFRIADSTTDYKLFTTLSVPVQPVYSSRTKTIQFYHQKLQIVANDHPQCLNPTFVITYQDSNTNHVFVSLNNIFSPINSVIPYITPARNGADNIHTVEAVNNTIYLDVSFYSFKGTPFVDETMFLSLQARKCQMKVTIKTLLNSVTYRLIPMISSFLHVENFGSDEDLQLSTGHAESDSIVRDFPDNHLEQQSPSNNQVEEGKDHSLKYNEISVQTTVQSSTRTIIILLICLFAPIALFTPLFFLFKKRQSLGDETILLDIRPSERDEMIERYSSFDEV